MGIREQDVKAAVQAVIDPETGEGLLELARLQSVRLSGRDVLIDLELAYPAQSRVPALREALASAVRALPGRMATVR